MTRYQIIYQDKRGAGIMRMFSDREECWKHIQKLYVPARVIDPETLREVGGVQEKHPGMSLRKWFRWLE